MLAEFINVFWTCPYIFYSEHGVGSSDNKFNAPFCFDHTKFLDFLIQVVSYLSLERIFGTTFIYNV